MRILPALLLIGCGGVSPEVLDRRLERVDSKLAALEEVNQANLSRLEALSDRLNLMSDTLEAQALAARRAPPTHLPVVKLAPPPPPEPEGPVPTMTQDDLEPRVVIKRRGPRRAVAPPANAAHAGNIGVAPLPVKAPSTPPPGALDEAIALFKKGQAEERRGALPTAIQTYQDFVARYPKHSYADNALFREGKCRYQRAEFAGALRSFMRVVSGYPTGNKVPDALLMIGLTQKKMGQAQKGRATLTRLMAMYPETKAAKEAATALQQSADRM